MLDYVLLKVAKLTKTLQTEHLDLSMILSLVDATLNTLDDTVFPLTNWVLELLDDCELLQKVAGIKVTVADITMFEDQSAKPFVAHLKGNISTRFASSSEVVSAMSIFEPRETPKKDSPDYQYGVQAIFTSLKVCTPVFPNISTSERNPTSRDICRKLLHCSSSNTDYSQSQPLDWNYWGLYIVE